MNLNQVSVRPNRTGVVRRSLIVLLVLLAGVLQGCSRRKFDVGKIDGSTYTNEFFDMKLTIPSKWVVAGEAEQKRVQEAGKQFIKSDNPIKQWAIEKSEERSKQLITISKGALGVTPLNSSFMCLAERIPALNPISRGSEYLASVKNLMQSSSVPMRVAKEVYPIEVGGKVFYALDLALRAGPMEVPQTYYAYVSHGYALVFVTTSFTDEDRETIGSLIRSITFKS